MHIFPEAVGVHPARLAHAVNLLREGVASGAAPGATLCAFRRGQLFVHEAIGTLDGTRPAALDTIYDLASLTKPLATGAVVLTLIERGDLLLTASLPSLLGADAAHLSGVTVKHLLTHTSGLPAWSPLYDAGLGHDAAVRAILRLPTVAPGTRYEYSCLGFVLLHRIIEAVTGKSLDALAREWVFAPLGMKDTGYCPADDLLPRIAPTHSLEGPDRDAPLTGRVHDGNARGIGGVSGNAGLFGTAHDVALFGEMLRAGGPKALFGAPTLARVFAPQIPATVGGHSLLFFTSGNGYCPTGDLLASSAVGHSGYTGTVLTLDPATDLTVALLSNSVYLNGKDGWLPLRRKFFNALAAALY